jgi:hypothetical protein
MASPDSLRTGILNQPKVMLVCSTVLFVRGMFTKEPNRVKNRMMRATCGEIPSFSKLKAVAFRNINIKMKGSSTINRPSARQPIGKKNTLSTPHGLLL